jgi:exonuclease III
MNHISYLFCTWNVRGLGQKNKCDELLSEIINIKPYVLLLQETKLHEIPNHKAKTFLPNHLNNFAYKPSVGSAGGILNAASNNCFNIKSTTHHQFALTTIITSTSNNQEIMVTNVYAPTDHDQKLPFLQEIQTIQPPSNTPWILLGDFNLMWNSTDKNNPSFRQDEADAFNDAIHNLALIELPLTDRLYTWSSNRTEPTLQRIDRVFINICWNQIFPNSTLSSLTRFTSDHVPLLITVSTHIPRPALFRFESS